MSWIDGSNPRLPFIDWNQRLLETPKGEIPEEQARELLGGFLMQNIGFTVHVLTGQILDPDQRIILKGWMQKNFSLCIAGRGCSKSYIAGHFSYLYALTHRDRHIIIVSATFRSSRRILEEIDKWAHRKRDGIYPGGELLLETFEGKLKKRPDMYQIQFRNESTITALPLGDADNLRGFRCDVLIIDEGLLVPQTTIESVLKPFLTKEADLTKKQRIQKKERRLIAAGRMTEDQKRKFPATSKMIILSSASYKWEELYQTYQKYLKIISPDPDAPENPDAPKREETDGEVSSYLVQQLSYKVARNRLSKTILQEIEEKVIPESVIKREYEAQFVDESGGYFSAREMKACTVEMGQLPTIEVVGERGAEYVLGIDPNMSSSDSADHFGMCVLKVIQRKSDNRKVGLVVHQYGCCGVELKHHIQYLYYLIAKFKPVYIVCDTTQGDNADFLTICNESEYFKARRMELNPIDAEFTGESVDEIVKQIKRSYNRDSSVNRIVQKQVYTSSVIKAANEYLRACFDQRLLWFPSHVRSLKDMTSQLSQCDVLDIHKTHPEYSDPATGGLGNMYEFVVYQDAMIERLKKEISLIEVTASPLGNLTFDLPHSMTKNRKNVNRQRRDNYAALLMANWGLKLYLGMQDVGEPPPDTSIFTPRWV